MKKKIINIGALLCIAGFAVTSRAQDANDSPSATNITNSAGASVADSLMTTSPALRDTAKSELSAIAKATNWTVAPYLSLKLDGATKNEVGGGLLVGYNFSKNVGAFAAADYLGQWSLFSGQMQIKVPIHPLAAFPELVVEPFVFAGIGTSASGAGSDNGGASVVSGFGGRVGLGHVWGGNIGAGLAAENVTGAGIYSGWRGNLFVGWNKGF